MPRPCRHRLRQTPRRRRRSTWCGSNTILGAASYLQLLTAQQQAQQTRIGLIAAQAARLADSAALYQAMGGGVLDTPGAATAAPPP